MNDAGVNALSRCVASRRCASAPRRTGQALMRANHESRLFRTIRSAPVPPPAVATVTHTLSFSSTDRILVFTMRRLNISFTDTRETIDRITEQRDVGFPFVKCTPITRPRSSGGYLRGPKSRRRGIARSSFFFENVHAGSRDKLRRLIVNRQDNV